MMLLTLLSTAFACPVCGGGGQNQQAFVDTMVFMSATPLLMIAMVVGGLFWIARRARELEAEEQEAAQADEALRQP